MIFLENRKYLNELRDFNEAKKGRVDEALTDIIDKVICVIRTGLSSELFKKLSELDEKVTENGINLLNRDC